MELFTLDEAFQPDKPVESYESLIWSERYSPSGDFEITTSNIAEMVALLPRESCVGLRDSVVPMRVENYEIVKPIRDKPQIKITGRSFDSVLDRRGSVKSLPSAYLPETTTRPVWMIEAIKESDAAYDAMRVVLGDVERTRETSSGVFVTLASCTPAVSPLDAIPELNLVLPIDYVNVAQTPIWVDTVPYSVGAVVKFDGQVWQARLASTNVVPGNAAWESVGVIRSFEIKPQNLYTTVTELLATNRHGIKAVRPTLNESQVDIEIYNGANLTGEGPTGDPEHVVTIDVHFDLFDSATYLLSERGSTNIGYYYGSDGSQVVYKNTYADPEDEPSGLQRRVLVVDGSSDAATADPEVRRTRGLIELYKYNATALFDGEVAQQIAAGYNKEYFLGDIVKLVGEYGLTQNARVVEFIRSQDATGEKAYPTFEAVDE